MTKPVALEIKNLRKTYHNGLEALKGIDLTVKEGDFFALLGPNGAGKSTTIGIITSLVNKTSGEVSVFGKSIDTDLVAAKRYIGLVPQEFNFNIFERVEDILLNQAGYYGVERKVAQKNVEHYLKKLGLWEKRAGSARLLSGGMKRRLMIARALIHNPKLLILDEPTAGVDIELRRSMWEFLREINQEGITVILTTHYLEEAENLCRNIAIIDLGKIIEHTSMKSILQKLNSETFILYLENSLSAAPVIPEFHCELLDEHSISVEVNKGQDINNVFISLSQQQIVVSSMRNKANRLEELFVKLTGKQK